MPGCPEPPVGRRDVHQPGWCAGAGGAGTVAGVQQRRCGSGHYRLQAVARLVLGGGCGSCVGLTGAAQNTRLECPAVRGWHGEADGVRLQVVDYKDPDHWRWLLQDTDGRFVADHEVALAPADPEYQGFMDLARFLQQRAVPDRRLASETELVDRVGRWIGRHVLGEQVGRTLVDAGPVVVDVVLPEDADFLLHRPMELAHVGGVPLARQDVSLVFQVEGDPRGATKLAIDRRLRLLAVFSLPTGGTALALRRERYALVRLVRRIATRYRRAIEVHVLQYGVTRQRLGDALRAGAGWDVVHFSGHGLADGLVLEREDGTADLVGTQDLVGLLRPARARLKLITLSSCLSAAATAAEARRWLDLVVPGELQGEATASATARPLPGLARELVRRLDCAVLAMRFSVVDDFAIALDRQLYEGLLGQDQPLARALQLAVPAACGDSPSVGTPAISVATPALFGPLATTLRLVPPPGQPDFNVGTAKMAFFPKEPERFVGRAGVLARASMALAPSNQQQHAAVLLHGMAGAGKTACALELAYRHEPVFGALVWWQAPEEGRDIATSLRDLAVALEAQLPGLAMVQATTSPAEFGRYLPRLTQLLEDQAILLILDNLESLLTGDGRWRDPAWQQLIGALLGHGGESRVILTSRIRPKGLDGPDKRVLVEPIHALSLDEALLLAMELPNLGRLLRQDPTPGPATGRQAGDESWVGLVRRVLQVVQGHPKLLELADAQAYEPAALAARLVEVEQALPGADRLGLFFDHGHSDLTPDQFLQVLGEWTRGVAGVLPDGARLLLWLVCGVEEADRAEPLLEAAWPQVWARLGFEGDPPSLTAMMQLLQAHALVQAEQVGGRKGAGLVRYRIHPGVAEAARAQAGPEVQQAVDTALARLWAGILLRALEAKGGEAGGSATHAGRSAAPYLIRLGNWQAAAAALEQTIRRDQSPTTVGALLPLLRKLAEATVAVVC
jgi:hypothetical protein